MHYFRSSFPFFVLSSALDARGNLLTGADDHPKAADADLGNDLHGVDVHFRPIVAIRHLPRTGTERLACML